MNLHTKSVTFDLDEHWAQVQGLLRTEFDDTAYRTWLAPLDLVGLEGDRVLLAVPTRFLRDWVAAHYADRIRALWRCVNPRIGGIALRNPAVVSDDIVRLGDLFMGLSPEQVSNGHRQEHEQADPGEQCSNDAEATSEV